MYETSISDMLMTYPNAATVAVAAEAEVTARTEETPKAEVHVAPFDDVQQDLDGGNNMVSEGSPNC